MGVEAAFVLGMDFGSNTARVLVVDARTGVECGVGVANYPSGDQGVLTDPANPHVARQRPGDYLAAMVAATAGALAQAAAHPGFTAAAVKGIGVDTTGSTPIPVAADMTPLADLPAFRDRLDAQAWMWKDHTGMEEAERITAVAREHRPAYLAKCGGTYSSEWFFSKLWHCLNVAPDVFDAAASWVEFADFIPAVLAGIRHPQAVRRGICAAGHKAMYCQEWGGLPDADFLALLDERLVSLLPRLYAEAVPADQAAGCLCPEWAAKLGLPVGIPIAVGAFDAHFGAVGSGVGPGRLVKIIGTSTCDIMVAPDTSALPDIPGVCGIVDGSVLPGFYGIEAGQSAVGDIFNWFVTKACAADHTKFADLDREAAKLKPGQSGLLALDWHNGNRTILVDPKLTGLLLGLTLHTTQAEIHRALVEATAFGAKVILDRLAEYGVEVREIICCGGIAEKNALLMQIYADILGRPMRISASGQACALGSAIFGAVVAGLYPDAAAAQQVFCRFKDTVYQPRPEAVAAYRPLYALYRELHDSFGVAGVSFDHAQVMKRLLALAAKAKG